jgi:dolichol-phosphate mannosyltransferase
MPMPELTIVVPVYNERENLVPLTSALASALKDIDYEVIFVDDDSPDGTAAAARALAQENPRIRVLHRIGRKGLSPAVVEGVLASSSPLVAVMDGDLQHDESILPAMIQRLREGGLDIVVGSRHLAGGGMGSMAKARVALSRMGERLSHWICGAPLSDPMSGYFVMTRSFFQETLSSLSLVGFKILVDLFASSPRPVRFAEVPYIFRMRERGESKLDLLTGVEYLQLLIDKAVRGWIPSNFLLYCFVGGAGVLFNLLLAALLVLKFGFALQDAHFWAAAPTIAFNFFLHNSLTFRSAKLKGFAIVKGLLSYFPACSIGLLAQVAVADNLHARGLSWIIASLAGVAIGSIWNYSMAYLLVWQVRRRRARVHRPVYLEPLSAQPGEPSAERPFRRTAEEPLPLNRLSATEDTNA